MQADAHVAAQEGICAIALVVASAIGAMVTTPAGRPPEVVAVTAPLSSVTIPPTYFEPPAAASQPQLPAPGEVPPDWYTSVIEVRQALSARMTSDIFARTV